MLYHFEKTDSTLMGVGLNGIAKGLQELLDIKIDFLQSQFNPRVANIITNKGVISNKTWNQAIEEMVSLGGGILQKGASIHRSGLGSSTKYYVRLKLVDDKVSEQVIVEPLVVEAPLVAEEEEVISKEDKPNLEYAQGLLDSDDEKGSRAKLEDYANTFGIKLSTRKRFENMMVDFKEAVDKL